MKTIQELTATIEELEKRIRTISTAQNTLAQLIEIREYMATVQTYLSELNTTFDDHVKNCTNYSETISTIQNQIDTINTTLSNMSNISDEQITELSNTVNTVKTKLENFLGSSTTALSTIENDISSLQTEIVSTQDDIESINSEISTINSCIGEHTTTLNNLQTTQTNLQTTQTNQASLISSNTSKTVSNSNKIATNTNNINALTTRVSSCETNINALSGGIDFSSLEERLKTVEKDSGQVVASENYNFHFSLNQNFFQTRLYYYNCAKNTFTFHSFDISYTCTNPTGNLTITSYLNYDSVSTKTISLADYPNGCKFEFVCKSQYIANNVRLTFDFTDEITFNTMSYIIFGNNIKIIKYDTDLSVITFNNNVWVTRRYPDRIKYCKYAITETMDLENLPYELLYNDSEFKTTWLCFTPFGRYDISDNVIKTLYDAVVRECVDGYHYIDTVPKSPTLITINGRSRPQISADFVAATMLSLGRVCAFKDSPAYDRLDYYENIHPLEKIGNFVSGSWTFATHINENYRLLEDELTGFTRICVIARNQDGYFYFIHNRSCDYVTKIGKGDYATAFKQPNGNINVYINKRDLTTDKYRLVLNSNTNKYQAYLITTIPDCTKVYETLNDTIIKNTSNGWVIDTLAY